MLSIVQVAWPRSEGPAQELQQLLAPHGAARRGLHRRMLRRMGLAWDVVEIAPERQAQKLAPLPG